MITSHAQYVWGFSVKYRVLVSDPLAEEGLAILRECCDVDVKTEQKPEDLVAIMGNYDALVVRSGTTVTQEMIDAGTKLKIIGRAGAGVDNIDVEAATRRGIPVVNAPEGNTLAATEHTMAMMLALARNIPQANASLRQKQWKRSKFIGVELNDKILGIVGLGRIGREIAKRANAMDMRCVAYDPFISRERASQLGVELMSLDDVLKTADVITVHTPLTKETHHLIGTEKIALMKDRALFENQIRTVCFWLRAES
jgi:D-3-phosphoglycerate dehydrogenase